MSIVVRAYLSTLTVDIFLGNLGAWNPDTLTPGFPHCCLGTPYSVLEERHEVEVVGEARWSCEASPVWA